VKRICKNSFFTVGKQKKTEKMGICPQSWTKIICCGTETVKDFWAKYCGTEIYICTANNKVIK